MKDKKKELPMAIIKFQARTYSPHLFFDKNPLWDFADVDVRVMAVRVPKRFSEFGFPGNSLASIREWMEAHDLECVGVAAKHKSLGPWRGDYAVKIGMKGERLTALEIAQLEEPVEEPVYIEG
ncbi:MAG: hypothetical protein JXA21_11430 [Anaerolineae bacterium]|nr:hypothetical protein [Anaerolineae bacterium]